MGMESKSILVGHLSDVHFLATMAMKAKARYLFGMVIFMAMFLFSSSNHVASILRDSLDNALKYFKLLSYWM